MQEVIISKDNFDTFQKNEFLTLEQAKWYTQEEGFIPLPRRANKENTYVIFADINSSIELKLRNKKIVQYRISKVFYTCNDIKHLSFNYIIVLEFEKSNFNNTYYFDSFVEHTILSKKKLVFTKDEFEFIPLFSIEI